MVVKSRLATVREKRAKHTRGNTRRTSAGAKPRRQNGIVITQIIAINCNERRQTRGLLFLPCLGPSVGHFPTPGHFPRTFAPFSLNFEQCLRCRVINNNYGSKNLMYENVVCDVLCARLSVTCSKSLLSLSFYRNGGIEK